MADNAWPTRAAMPHQRAPRGGQRLGQREDIRDKDVA